MRDTLAGIMLGAEFPVGEGTLRAEMMRPTMQGASPTYGLRYNQRFAHGGQVQRFDEGGEVSQSELDRMRFEIAQQQNPSSPVMQATPRGAIQDFIGTAGGYMDQAGKFVSEALEPIAESHPVKHFLADMLLASPLKGAGTALQDYTGTVRETDEERPVRGVIDKDWRKFSTGTEPLLDPRVLDIAQFASPVVRGATKLAGAGAKAIEPFATRVDDMVRELHASGAIPQPGLSIKDVIPKALAPANAQGFYSPTEAAALNLQRKSGSGQALLNDILKGENVRSEEIKAMGLDTFLKDKKNVTAAEVQDYIAQNKLGLGEGRYGAMTKDISESRDAFKAYGQELAEKYNIPAGAIEANAGLKNIPAEEMAKYERLKNEWLDQQPRAAKFSGYQLPGGENYREVVITTPIENQDALNAAKTKAGDLRRQTGDLMQKYKDISVMSNPGDPDLIAAYQKVAESRKLMNQAEAEADKLRTVASEKTYRSSHFDEPNVLAHLRMSDRVTDGKKTLLVDEVQSDWHQAGREKGYKSDFKPVDWNDPEYVKARSDSVDATNAFNRASGNPALQATLRAEMDRAREVEVGFANVSNKINRAVPNAPYKEDWYQLALRRAVKEAIDGGYDRVALPTGARAADRFDLTKYIDRIAHKKNADGTYSLAAVDKEGKTALNDKSVPQDKLAGIVGKEVAQKIIDAEGKGYPKGSVSEDMLILSGLDLKVGGEGMKKYYDEIYPGYLKKFGKKYGASIGKTTTDVEGAAEPLHYMDITPAMRKEFSTGIHMKKGGKVSFADSLDAMRHELTKAK
jgi:hypothetical protein